MKAISSSITKIVALIAAMVVAFGTFGLAAAHADGYDKSTITDPEKNGEITINRVSGDTQTRSFNGYRLASLKNVKTDSTGTALESFTVETNGTYTPVIETAMRQITTDASTNKTLLDDYKDDASYYSNTGAIPSNPLGYIAATYGGSSLTETTKPWGGDNADGSNDTVLRQFADKLAAALAADPKYQASYTTTLTTGENTVKNSVDQGLYLITETTTLADSTDRAVTGAAVNSAPMIVSTTYRLKDAHGTETDITTNVGTIDLKATSPTITKEVTNGNTVYGDAKANPDFSIGDEVDYELTATIPSYTGYDIDTTGDNTDEAKAKARVLKIYDKAEPGLTITADSVESVYVDGTKLSKNTDYTVTSGPYTNPDDADDSYNGGTQTVVDLANYVNMRAGTVSANNHTVASGGKITVEIKATLNSKAKAKASDATSTPTPIKNETTLGYSHIPNKVTDEHKQPGGEVYVYTYKFKITKKNREGTSLPGAQFAIKNGDDYLAWDDTNAKWTNLGKTKPTAAAQVKAAPDDQSTDNKAGIFYSGADGTVSFDGLKAGTYTIEEIASPSGYLNALLPSFKVTITPHYDPDTSTKPTGAASWGDYKISTTTDKPLTISNDKGSSGLVSDIKDGNVDVTNVTSITQLPKTGAAGIAFFAIVGVALIGAAALFAVRARKARQAV